jgi:dGTPase
VSQIARAIARALGLDEDLAEALALSHDLGHTPFGHTGEDALDDCMTAYGGFDHNAQALRVVARLERRYADFDGLNLTWETLEGLVKHNGPLVRPDGGPTQRYAARGILEHDAVQDLGLSTFASGEAQAAALADDIAYDAHDLDDGLRAGLFAVEDLRGVPYLVEILAEVDGRWPGLEPTRRIHELVRRVITGFVEDAITQSEMRLAALAPGSAEDIRHAGTPVIAFSDALQAADAAIKQFLFPRMYRHPDVLRVRRDADRILRDLFARFLGDPRLMPHEWHQDLSVATEREVARRIADYMAGMTDGYALAEHRRLFADTPELR